MFKNMTSLGKGLVGFALFGIFLVLGVFIFLQNENMDNEETSDNEKELIVYETEVDGPNDCSSFEKYDAERKICSYECETENQCSEMQKQIDDELATWSTELEKDTEPVAEKKISKDVDAEATYAVSIGENISLETGTDTEENRKIWDDISALAPDYLSDTYIETYEVFNSPTDDTLAFVDDQDSNGKWRVAVNLAGHKSSTEREQKSTLIHELGHIITLNSSQVVPDIAKEECENFHIDEGCSNQNSYINNFKNNFWAGVDKQDFDEESFTTEYATTNEVEDMAESFAFFVLANNFSSENIKNQKINFFNTFPELVEIRKSMRNTLAKNIVRAKKSTN